jgi:hypothetical protein
MKNRISAALQILVALTMTGSMAYAMQPTVEAPKQVTSNSSSAPIVEAAIVPTVDPVAEPTATAPESQITWQDNPNKCNTDTQFISQDAPFNCVDKPAPQVAAPQSTYIPSGNQYDWLLASGIPQEYWRAVDYIVSRESGWNPCASYPRTYDCSLSPTNACGLVMQNPCGKIPGDWRDPVAALKWQYQYVTSVYGGYPQAVEHWKIYQNY